MSLSSHTPPVSTRRFGWIPDLPDRRDYAYEPPPQLARALPAHVDLRPGCPAVYDQGNLGSCTAQALAAAIEFDQAKQRLTDRFAPSRLFIYYNERAMEGTIGEDAGAMLRDGIKSVNTLGAPHEQLWPYVTPKFRARPPARAFSDARAHTAVRYERVSRSLTALKTCLASGYPFVLGFSVYESFESDDVASTGVMPMPLPSEPLLGGHAVIAVGYDDRGQRFLVRNSWGARWGDDGYFQMPYDYLLDANLSDDFWTVRLVS